MGCDGGTIPRRDELVRLKKKPEQKDKEAELAFRWRHCTIKQLPLQPPIVACGLGKLYSKEAVIEGLLDRTLFPESAEHLKSLKDIKALNLTPNPGYNDSVAEKGDGYVDNGKSPYICPVMGLEMNGKYKFCYLWTCGCVISDRALKHVKSATCHMCQTPFEPTDVVILNADGDELALMQENINIRKSLQKNKKKRNNGESSKEGESDVKKVKKEEKSSIKKSKVKREEPQDPSFRKAREDYSVAKDPEASEVLKSIFTTHKSAAEQTKAHWVTYNPFYN